ncbi:MAG: HAD family phosphatase [Deltaproteobacteria bacterium]|nr:HAD family phosphatase [Deltaproteobacteria bacterium]
MRTLFAFDLDGTVTRAEILPAIARAAGVFDEMSRLTALTLDGALDFESSFRQRFDLLRRIPPAEVRRITAAVPLDPEIEAFIAENKARCAIVTGNLDCWISPLAERLGCAIHSSRSAEDDGGLSLVSVLRKGPCIERLRRQDRYVVAIGDGANDIPMLLAADYGIAFGGLREPARGLLAVADRTERDASSLCRFLRSFM